MLLHVWDTVCLSVLKALRKSTGKKVPVALFLITICFTGLFSALLLHEMLLVNGLSLPRGKLDCVHRMSWCLPFSVYEPTVSLLQQQTTLVEKLISIPPKSDDDHMPSKQILLLVLKGQRKAAPWRQPLLYSLWLFSLFSGSLRALSILWVHRA